MNQDEETKWRDGFREGMKTVQLTLLGTFLFAGALALLVFKLGPIFGPIITALLIYLGVVAVTVYILARTVRYLKVRRKKKQDSLCCAFCKDMLKAVESTCPSCGSVYHQECFRINGGCSTYACTLSKRDVVSEKAKLMH